LRQKVYEIQAPLLLIKQSHCQLSIYQTLVTQTCRKNNDENIAWLI